MHPEISLSLALREHSSHLAEASLRSFVRDRGVLPRAGPLGRREERTTTRQGTDEPTESADAVPRWAA